jgi:hypothetical protein
MTRVKACFLVFDEVFVVVLPSALELCEILVVSFSQVVFIHGVPFTKGTRPSIFYVLF